jgi:four helix bundle protein
MGRQYRKDTLQFQYIARGSLYELETLLYVAKMLEILDEMTFNKMISLTAKTVQVLNGLINYLEKSNLK